MKTSKLKVCFITGTLLKGGAERQLYYMVKSLNQANVKIYVLCLTKGDYFQKKIEQLGVDVYYVGEIDNWFYRAWKIRCYVKKFQPDIIQSSIFYTNLYAYISTLFLNIKSIGAIRNDFYFELKSNPLSYLSCRLPKIKIVNSLQAIKEMKKDGININKTYYLPNVVDTNLFIKKHEKIKRKKLRIISISNFKTQKRQDIFLRVLKELDKKDIGYESFLISSRDPDNLFDKLQLLSQTLNLSSSKFKIIIEKGEVPKYYQNADIFVLTSDHEGMPNVVLEAMSCSLPVISTNVGAVPDIIRDNESGFIIPVGDYKKIAEKIEILINNRILRKKMGKKGREIIEENFSLEYLKDRLLNIYDKILNKNEK